MIVNVPVTTQFSFPHTSMMMPSESACRNLSSQLRELLSRHQTNQDDTYAAGFLSGIYDNHGIHEFAAKREAKEIAFQVLTISHRNWDSVIPV